MTQPIRVVLVDDHAMVRKGLQYVIQIGGQVQVVGEAADATAALEVLRTAACDVVVTDLSLPGKDGLWLVRQIKEQYPDQTVLILTMHAEEHLVVSAIRAGASGYLLKSATSEELVEAVCKVYETGFYLHPSVAGPVLQEVNNTRSPRLVAKITAREVEILESLARGLSNRDIARRSHLAESTIKAHLRNLYRKLGVNDRTQAILHGLKVGLIGEKSPRA